MHAGLRNERDLNFGIFSPLPFNDLHPEMSLKRLGRGNGGEVVSVVFIPAGQETVVTPRTLIQVDEHPVVFHYSPPGIILIKDYT
jgi:hypothetical protein